MKKIMVGMSGGVDSSVTAYLLKEEGYEVEGISFLLYEMRMKPSLSGCCSIESIEDAGRTAAHIGVRHTVVDLREEFLELVIEPFIEAYKKGLTPNPCILCNKHIKFPWLLRLADERGAEHIATGHYANVIRCAGNGEAKMSLVHDSPILRFADSVFLKKGIDPKKDQSYVLYALRRGELSRLVLPLGPKLKQEVRETAAGLHMPAAARPESQEICFIGDSHYCTFLDGLAGKTEGPIINIETGKILGTHKGIHLYTIGQRKRMGIAVGSPLYVTKIDPALNAVYVGPREAAMQRAFRVEEINWLVQKTEPEILRLSDPFSFRAGVKVRSTMKEEPAAISLMDGNAAEIVYDEPQWAPAPGQSAVFYDGERVLGGGIIH